MADNKDLTVYQKLFYLFGQNKNPERSTPKYSFGDGELVTMQSKQEYDKQKLESQQKNHLEAQWARVDSELYQKAVYYETSRIASYMDYEAMEFTPEISAALDIMAEESCLVGSTIIPLLNGENISIEDLYTKNYTNFWVYGVKIDEDKIKPSKVDGVIYKGEKNVYKITLDDGTEIKCTDDHRWLSFTNEWVETSNLKKGDSLKSIYSKKSKNGYEKVSLTGFWKDYDLTHRIVSENQLKDEKKILMNSEKYKSQKIVIHHKSFNKLNNEPSQLEYMFWDDHQKLHTDLNSKRWENIDYSNKMRDIFSETAKKTWSKLSKEDRFKKRSKESKKYVNSLTKEERNEVFGRVGDSNGMFNIQRFGVANPNYDETKNHLIDINEEEYVKFISSIRGNRIELTKIKFNLTEQAVILFNKKLCEKYGLQRIEDINFINNEAFSINNIKNFILKSKNPKIERNKYINTYNIDNCDLTRFINKKGYKNWSDIVNTMGNHRIVNIEYVGVEKVYDLIGSSVDSTFAVKCDTGMVISHNCTPSEQGKVLTIQSNSKRVKNVLEDLFYNVLDIQTNLPMWTRNTPIRENSVIPLLDGTETTIKELSNRVKSGEEIWSYAIQDGTKAIVPSKIVWCDLTRKDSELYRVTLDDGTYIDTTPDHEYMLRDGSFERADKLTEGQSLMPFYSRKEIIRKNDKNGYEKVFNPQNNKYVFTHRLVVKEDGRSLNNEKDCNDIFVSHHVVINHKVVSVVKLTETSDVYCLEAVGPNGEHDRHNFPVCGKDINGSYSRGSGVFLLNCKYGDNFVYLKIDNKKGIVGSSQLTNIEIERKEEGMFPVQKEGNTTQQPKKKQVIFHWREKAMDFNPWEVAHFRLLGDDRRLPYGTSILEKARRIWKQMLLAEDAMLVYRVVRAPERRVFKIYVGNIDDKDVDAYVNKIANKFKRQQLVDQKSGQVDLRYNTLAVDQDYFVPVRDQNAPNPIDTLAGASNLDQIADIEYIQKKLLTALRVPKTFLGFDEPAGEGKNLALLDIRFARTINKIQQSMIQELNKLAIIHLFILGFTDDLNNFTLNLTNPSTQGEMLKVEQWKEKVLLYKDLVSQIDSGIAPSSHTWAKKNIFNWTDEEIKTDLEQQMMERAASKELENTAEIIKKTGFFDRVTKLYGEIGGPTKETGGEETVEEEESGFGGGFGGGAGGGFGGGAGGGLELGGEETEVGAEPEETGGGTEVGFGESFRYKNKNIVDKLLLEGRKKNEDIMMMTEGIKNLIGEEDENNEDLDEFDLLQD